MFSAYVEHLCIRKDEVRAMYRLCQVIKLKFECVNNQNNAHLQDDVSKNGRFTENVMYLAGNESNITVPCIEIFISCINNY